MAVASSWRELKSFGGYEEKRLLDIRAKMRGGRVCNFRGLGSAKSIINYASIRQIRWPLNMAQQSCFCKLATLATQSSFGRVCHVSGATQELLLSMFYSHALKRVERAQTQPLG
jgi:hypothetical protein